MMRSEPIRVMVVDKSAIIREGLEDFLGSHEEFSFVGAASTGVEAVFRSAKIQPEIIMLGLSISESHIEASIGALRRVCPSARIVIFSEPDQEQRANATLQAGAIAYVLTTINPDDLRRTLQMISKRATYAAR